MAMFFEDPLKSGDTSYNFLTPARSSFPGYDSSFSNEPGDSEHLGNSPLGNGNSGGNKMFYDDSLPPEFKDMQGLQDSEEMLVGKIVGNAPKGTKGGILETSPSLSIQQFQQQNSEQQRQGNSNNNLNGNINGNNFNNLHSMDNMLLEKILAPQQQQQQQQQIYNSHFKSDQFKKMPAPNPSLYKEPGSFNKDTAPVSLPTSDHADHTAIHENHEEPTKAKEINCDPVQMSEVANCTNSMDPICKDDDVASFRNNGLHQHQVFRRIHQTPPLELNNMLNSEAQNYSSVLANAPKLTYSDPRDRPGQGENIAVRCSDDGSMLSAKEAVSYWYNKACKDEKLSTHFSPEITQFAQIVWKATNFVGMGRTAKKKGDLLCTYIVARYSPQATKDGFSENVPQFDSRKICVNRCLKESEHKSSESSESGHEKSESKPHFHTYDEHDAPHINEMSSASSEPNPHEAIFNKMKDITDEDRQHIKARTEENRQRMEDRYHDTRSPSIELDHTPIGYKIPDSQVAVTGSSKKVELTAEVRQAPPRSSDAKSAESKSAEYPMIIHKADASNATKTPVARSPHVHQDGGDLDLGYVEHDKSGNKGAKNNKLDLTSQGGQKNNTMDPEGIVAIADGGPRHPERFKQKHRVKERERELNDEKEEEEIDDMETNLEHQRYMEKMRRHHEKIESQSREQRDHDLGQGNAFMERFLSSEPGAMTGVPSFDASKQYFHDTPKRKKKRRRRKKKYDDEDDEEEDRPISQSDSNEDMNDETGDIEPMESTDFKQKGKGGEDDDDSYYDATGKLVSKHVDASFIRVKSDKEIAALNTKLKEESTLVNPHAPEDPLLGTAAALDSKQTIQITNDTARKLLVQNKVIYPTPAGYGGSKSFQNNLNLADKIISDAAAKNNLHVKIVLNPKVVPSENQAKADTTEQMSAKTAVTQTAKLAAKPAVVSKVISKQPQSPKLVKAAQNMTKTSTQAASAIRPIDVEAIPKEKNETKTVVVDKAGAKEGPKIVKLTKEKATASPTEKVKIRAKNNKLPDEAESKERTHETPEKVKAETVEKADDSADDTNKVKEENVKASEEKSEEKPAETDKLDSADVKQTDSEAKAASEEKSTASSENFDEPFEKSSDDKTQLKINKKVSKVQPLSSEDDEDNKEKSKRLPKDFQKVNADKSLKDDAKSMAHFEDIGEETSVLDSQHPKAADEAETAAVVAAESTLAELNNSVSRTEVESDANQATQESNVAPLEVPPMAAMPQVQPLEQNNKTVDDIMTFLTNASRQAPGKSQQSFTKYPGPPRFDEEELPVFQEVTDSRITNNEEADINELSQTAGLKPTRPQPRTEPGLQISRLTRDGLAELSILEKASPKTGDPATRHMLQTLIDNMGANKDTSYIQLIPAKDLNEFRREMVDRHNKYRGIHLAKALHLDKQLSKDAQTYAAYVAKHNSVAHSDPRERPDIGESVAEMCTKEGVLPTAEHIVAKWYSEICNPGFDFNNETKQPGTGHFTQIIWKDTDKLGVGLAVANHPNGDSCSYVVARYKSAGNYLDKFKENVFEGYFSKERCGDAIESNVISRNVLPHAAAQETKASVREMKGHAPKRHPGVKYAWESFNEKLARQPNILNDILNNTATAHYKTNHKSSMPTQKFKVEGLAKKKIEIDFEVRADSEEDPQSKSSISRGERYNSGYTSYRQDVDKRSSIRHVDSNAEIRAMQPVQRVYVNRADFNFGEEYFNGQDKLKIDRRSKIPKASKRQEQVTPEQLGMTGSDPESITFPVNSVLIGNHGEVSPYGAQQTAMPAPEAVAQDTNARHDMEQQPYQMQHPAVQQLPPQQQQQYANQQQQLLPQQQQIFPQQPLPQPQHPPMQQPLPQQQPLPPPLFPTGTPGHPAAAIPTPTVPAQPVAQLGGPVQPQSAMGVQPQFIPTTPLPRTFPNPTSAPHIPTAALQPQQQQQGEIHQQSPQQETHQVVSEAQPHIPVQKVPPGAQQQVAGPEIHLIPGEAAPHPGIGQPVPQAIAQPNAIQNLDGQPVDQEKVLSESKSFAEQVNQILTDDSSTLVRQNLASMPKNGTLNSTKEEVVIPTTATVKVAKETTSTTLPINATITITKTKEVKEDPPESMLPEKGTKETLERASSVYGNRCLPPAIMKNCNKTVSDLIPTKSSIEVGEKKDLIEGVAGKSSGNNARKEGHKSKFVDVGADRKFSIPSKPSTKRLQSAHLDKKDVENEVEKFFKTQVFSKSNKRSKQKKKSKKNKAKKKSLAAGKEINQKAKRPVHKKSENEKVKNEKVTPVKKNETFRKPSNGSKSTNASISKTKLVPQKQNSTSQSNDTDLEYYLSNIVVNLHKLDTAEPLEIAAHAKVNLLAKKNLTLLSDLGHKRTIKSSRKNRVSQVDESSSTGSKRLIDTSDVLHTDGSYSATEMDDGTEKSQTDAQNPILSEAASTPGNVIAENDVTPNPQAINEPILENQETAVSQGSSVNQLVNIKDNAHIQPKFTAIQDSESAETATELHAAKQSERLLDDVTADKIGSLSHPALSTENLPMPHIKALQPYSKELEKEVQRIPPDEINDSNREAKVVANHLASSIQLNEPQVLITKLNRKNKNIVVNADDTTSLMQNNGQTRPLKGTLDDLYSNDFINGKRRNVNSNKNKLLQKDDELTLAKMKSPEDRFDDKIPLLKSVAKIQKLTEPSEKAKDTTEDIVADQLNQLKLQKLKELKESQRLKDLSSRKRKEKEMKNFNEAFMKEAEKLIAESNTDGDALKAAKLKQKAKNKLNTEILNTNNQDKEESEEETSSSTKVRPKPLPIDGAEDNEKNGDDEKIEPGTKYKGQLWEAKIKQKLKTGEDKLKNENEYEKVENEENLSAPVDKPHAQVVQEDEDDVTRKPKNPSLVEQSALMALNRFRAIHHSPALQLSAKLSKDAQEYADEIIQKHAGVLVKSPIMSRPDEGENLAIDCDPHDNIMSGTEAVEKWYKELCEKGYNFNAEPIVEHALTTQHFTQTVWRQTRYVGVGIVTTKKNKMTCTIVVARFHPPGNVPRQYKKNIAEGHFDTTICESLKGVPSEDDEAMVGHTTVAPSTTTQTTTDEDVDQHNNNLKIYKSQNKPPPVDEPNVTDADESSSETAHYNRLKAQRQKMKNKGEEVDEEESTKQTEVEDSTKAPAAESELEKARQSKLAQKVVDKLESLEEEKQDSKFNNPPNKPAANNNNNEGEEEDLKTKYGEKVKNKHKANEEEVTPEADQDLADPKLPPTKEGKEGKETANGKSDVSLDDLESPTHLKGSPLDEVDDEPNLKFIRNKEHIDENEEVINARTEGTRILPPGRLKAGIFPGNDTAEADGELLWNRDDAGKSHVAQPLLRSNPKKASLNIYTDHGAYKVNAYKLNKQVVSRSSEETTSKLPKNASFVENLDENERADLLHKLLNTGTQKATASFAKPLNVTSLSENTGPGEESDALTEENSDMTSSSGKYKSHAAEQIEKALVGTKEHDHVKPKPHKQQKLKDEEIKDETTSATTPSVITEDIADDLPPQKQQKKPNALTEQKEEHSTAGGDEGVKYEAPKGGKGGKKPLQHLDQAHNEHAGDAGQPLKPGDDETQEPPLESDEETPLKKPKGTPPPPKEGMKLEQPGVSDLEGLASEQKKPTRKPPTGLKGHGAEEQAGEDGNPIIGDGMLDEEEPKKPSKRPTFQYDVKPITSASPTVKPLVIPIPKPISTMLIPPAGTSSSAIDVCAKLVQTLGPWPSVSFSSFGSPVVLHIGATGFYEDELAFLRIGLSTHNKLRKIHGSPPMVMDRELTSMAYKHAVYLTNLGYLKHEAARGSRGSQMMELVPGVRATMGENLFLGCYDGEYDISAEEAVMRWYAEVCSPGHCFNKTSQCSGTGHFSQVVWSSSLKLGMAKATRMQNGLRCTYVVAKYFPEGNEHMSYNENVMEGKFSEKETCHDVMETLVTFETRNINKANMVAKEKCLAREEFLKSLKDAEEQVTESMNKEIATGHLHGANYYQGMDLEAVKQGLPTTTTNITAQDGVELHPGVDHPAPEPEPAVTEELAQDDVGEKKLTDNEEKKLKADKVKIDVDPVSPQTSTKAALLNKLQEKLKNDAEIHSLLLDGKIGLKIGLTKTKERSVASDEWATALVQGRKMKPLTAEDVLKGFKKPKKLSAGSMFTVGDPLVHAGETIDDQETGISKKHGLHRHDVMGFEMPYLNEPLTLDKAAFSKIKEKAKQMEKANTNEDEFKPAQPRPERLSPVKGLRISAVKPSKQELDLEDKKLPLKDKDLALKQQELESKHQELDIKQQELEIKQQSTTEESPAADLESVQKTPKLKIGDSEAEEVDQTVNAQDKIKPTKEEIRAKLKGDERILTDKTDADPTKEELRAAKLKSAERVLNDKAEPERLSANRKPRISNKPTSLTEEPREETATDGETTMGGLPLTKTASQNLPNVNTDVEGGPKDPTAKEEEVQAQDAKPLKQTLLNEPAESIKTTSSADEEADLMKTAVRVKPTVKPMRLTLPKVSQDPVLDTRPAITSEEKDPVSEPTSHSRPTTLKLGGRRPSILDIKQGSETDETEPSLNVNNPNEEDSVNPDMLHTSHRLHQSTKASKAGLANLESQLEGPHGSMATGFKTPSGKEVPSKLKLFQPDAPHSSHDFSSSSLKLNPSLVGGFTSEEASISPQLASPLPSVSSIPEVLAQPVNPANPLKPAVDPSHPSPNAVKIECKVSMEGGDSSAAPHLPSQKCGAENEIGKSFKGPITGDTSLFQLSALNAHNAYRHVHDAPSLLLNEQMSHEAMLYARQIAQAGSLRHSGTEDGENIATVCRNKDVLMTGQEASTIWYREVCDPGYDFAASLPGKAGHFTQVVWKSSHMFGIGRASQYHNGLLCTYIVARYRPAGNFIGEFAENVLRGHFRSPHECVNLARKRSGIRYPRSVIRFPRSVEDVIPKNSTVSFIPGKSALGPLFEGSNTTSSFSSPLNLTTSVNNSRRSLTDLQTLARIPSDVGYIPQEMINDTTKANEMNIVHKRLKINKKVISMKAKKKNKNKKLISKNHKKLRTKFEKSADLTSNKLVAPSKREYVRNKNEERSENERDNESEDHSDWRKKAFEGPDFSGRFKTDHKPKFKEEYPEDDYDEKPRDKQRYHDNEDGDRYDDDRDSRDYDSPRDDDYHGSHPPPADDEEEHRRPFLEAEKPHYGASVSNDNGGALYAGERERSKGFHDEDNREPEYYPADADNMDQKADQQDVNGYLGGVLDGVSHGPREANEYNKKRSDTEGVRRTSIASDKEKASVAIAQKIGQALLEGSNSNEDQVNNVVDPFRAKDDVKQQPSKSNDNKDLIEVEFDHSEIKNAKSEDANSANLESPQAKPEVSSSPKVEATPTRIDVVNADASNEDEGTEKKSPVNKDAELPANILNDKKELLKMAKIGHIALKLAKKKAMQRKLAEKIQRGSLEGVDLLSFLKDKEKKASGAVSAVTLQKEDSKGETNSLKSEKTTDAKADEVKNVKNNEEDLDEDVAANKTSQDKKDNFGDVNPLLTGNFDKHPPPGVLTSGHAPDGRVTPSHDFLAYQMLQNDGLHGQNPLLAKWQRFNSVENARAADPLTQLHNLPPGSLIHDHEEEPRVAPPATPFNLQQPQVTLPLSLGPQDIQNIPHYVAVLLPTNIDRPLPHLEALNEHPAEIKAILNDPSRPSQQTEDFNPANLNSEFVQSSLNLHNLYRGVHDSPPLALDPKLILEAKERAYFLAGHGVSRKSEVPTQNGENVAILCKEARNNELMTGPDATMTWYNTACSPTYVFGSNREQTRANPFKQVVWQDTRLMGIARSTFDKDSKKCSVVVAKYTPALEKSIVNSNVVQGDFDSASYCDGLGSIVPEGSEDLTGNDVRAALPKRKLSENTQDFRQEALNLQNELRQIHGSPPLKLDDELCIKAEIYAAKLAGEGGGLKRSDTPDGESIVRSCTSRKREMTADEAVRKWYNEICNPGYSFILDTPNGGTGSVTQMLWKDTGKMGIGKATSEEDGLLCTYIVGRYNKRGNIPDQYKANVLKGSFDYGYCESLGKSRVKKGARAHIAQNNKNPHYGWKRAMNNNNEKRHRLRHRRFSRHHKRKHHVTARDWQILERRFHKLNASPRG